jgi:hypothetical protein
LRLAFLSIHELPPGGPHEQAQRVNLSDKRHLTLTLAFDGLGMQTEVSYIVPYLELQQYKEAHVNALETRERRASFWKLPRLQRPAFANFFKPPVHVAAIARLVLACLFMLNLFKAEPKPSVVSSAKVVTFQERLKSSGYLAPGFTEHRVVRYEKSALDGRKLQRGTVEVWRDADSRRWSRHFYNESHHVVAAESYEKTGTLEAQAGKPEASDWKAEISSETLSKVPLKAFTCGPWVTVTVWNCRRRHTGRT